MSQSENIEEPADCPRIAGVEASTGEEVWHPADIHELNRNIVRLTKQIEREWCCFGFKSPEIRLRSILEEGAINAWMHGNGKNPDRAVIIRWSCENDVFQLEIIDEGNGFNHASPPDPTSSENITKPCGRGIFIMRYFAKNVRWEQGGRHLIVTFDRLYSPAD